MILEERLDVPNPKSSFSTSPTFQPRSAASRAIPEPVMPPPITSTSSGVRAISSRASARPSGEKGWGVAVTGGSRGGALPGEQRLHPVGGEAGHAGVAQARRLGAVVHGPHGERDVPVERAAGQRRTLEDQPAIEVEQ